jgi:hypothetical protein
MEAMGGLLDSITLWIHSQLWGCATGAKIGLLFHYPKNRWALDGLMPYFEAEISDLLGDIVETDPFIINKPNVTVEIWATLHEGASILESGSIGKLKYLVLENRVTTGPSTNEDFAQAGLSIERGNIPLCLVDIEGNRIRTYWKE